MAWYHIYQFAEVTDPMYPKLKALALPVMRYEVCDQHILALELKVPTGEERWFTIKQVMLYRSDKRFLSMPEQRMSATRWHRFLKFLNIKRR